MLKKFQDLTLEEHKEILQWRNHPDIRQWMFTKKNISLEEHLDFVHNLDKRREYYKYGNIGVLNFKISDKNIEVGLHKNPYRQNVGALLMQQLLQKVSKYDKKVLLYVYAQNKKALHLYKKYGFSIIAKDKNIITMELQR